MLAGLLSIALAATDPGLHVHAVPEFCSDGQATTIQAGPWSDPATWTAGYPPPAGARVRIGHDVTFDVVSDAALECLRIEPGAALRFAADVDTRLTVGTLLALGTLEIGTEAAPIAAGVIAEIVIASRPFDLVADPLQFANGLLVTGAATLRGSTRTPFLRTVREPHAGDRALELEAEPDGWRPGDRLFLPDTRQPVSPKVRTAPPMVRQGEELTVSSVAGKLVILAAPLRFAHSAARDGDGKIVLLPHVANLTRNVVIRSAPGIRGHAMFMHRALVDLAYAGFEGLGRTHVETKLHSPLNQVGRYPLHIHHVFGPATPRPGGQFTARGNVVNGSPKWGIAVHNSHFGQVVENVVVNVRSAGIVTEDGTETNNLIARNFVAGTSPPKVPPTGSYGFPSDGLPALPGGANNPGTEGSCFWFNGSNNDVRDNVAAQCHLVGFEFALLPPRRAFVPPLVPGEDSTKRPANPVRVTEIPSLRFTSNEAYSVRWGVLLWRQPLLLQMQAIDRFAAWHFAEGGVDGLGGSLHVTRLRAYGDQAMLKASPGVNVTNAGSDTLGSYSQDLIVEDSTIEGTWLAIGASAREFTLNRSYLRSYHNLQVSWDQSIPRDSQVRQTTFRRPSFLATTGKPFYHVMLDPPVKNLLDSRFIWTEPRFFRVLDSTFETATVTERLNSQLFYPEQAPGYVMRFVGSAATPVLGFPLEGLTNAEAWGRYRAAVGGMVATCNAKRPDVAGGFVCPESPLPAVVIQTSVLSLAEANYRATLKGIYRLTYTVNGVAATPEIVPLALGWNTFTRPAGSFFVHLKPTVAK